MPQWLPPLAAAAFAVLLLNIALIVQRVRERSKSWPGQSRRDLRDWDGRLPNDHDKQRPSLTMLVDPKPLRHLRDPKAASRFGPRHPPPPGKPPPSDAPRFPASLRRR